MENIFSCRVVVSRSWSGNMVAVNLLGWVRLITRSVECDGEPYSAITEVKVCGKNLALVGR